MVFVYRFFILALVFSFSVCTKGQRRRHFSRYEYSGPNDGDFSQRRVPRPFLNYEENFPGDYEQGEDYDLNDYGDKQQGPNNGYNRMFHRRKQTQPQSSYDEPLPRQLRDQKQNSYNEYDQDPNSSSQNQDKGRQYDQGPNFYPSQNEGQIGDSQFNPEADFDPAQDQTLRQGVPYDHRGNQDQNSDSQDTNTDKEQKLIELFSNVQTLHGKLDSLSQRLQQVYSSFQNMEQLIEQQSHLPQQNQSPQTQLQLQNQHQREYQQQQQNQPPQQNLPQRQNQPQQQNKPQQQKQPQQQDQSQLQDQSQQQDQQHQQDQQQQQNQPQQQNKPQKQNQPQQTNQLQQLNQPQQQNQLQIHLQDTLLQEQPQEQSQNSIQQKGKQQSSTPGLLNFFIAPPTAQPTLLQKAQTEPQPLLRFLHIAAE